MNVRSDEDARYLRHENVYTSTGVSVLTAVHYFVILGTVPAPLVGVPGTVFVGGGTVFADSVPELCGSAGCIRGDSGTIELSFANSASK